MFGYTTSGVCGQQVSWVTWFLSVAKRLFALRSDCDLVHIHYNHWAWCRVLTRLSRVLNIPVVVSLNTELWVSARYLRLVSGKHFNLSRWIERRAVGSSDAVIALTEQNANRCKSGLNLDPASAFVIPDSIEEEEFRSHFDSDIVGELRRQYALPEGVKVVVYIGRIRREKGWEDLPQLAMQLRRSNAFLLICGDGPDRAKLERRMCESDCGGNWKITGFLDPERIRRR